MRKTPSAKNVTLAPLPFENLSESSEYDHFASGFIDDLVIDLAHFHDLNIISSFTSNQLAKSDNVLGDAKRLSIDYLLTGSLHYLKNDLRINTQLVDTVDGGVIWAERFSAPKEDIFDVQESVVERVVYAISSEVEQTMLAAARSKPATSLEAYELFLKGMDKLSSGTLESDQEARELFHQALVIDPHYSRAYIGLSLSHFNEWSCQLWELFESSEQNAYNYAVKAFQLDDSDHIINMILGRVYMYRRQFDEAEHHIERSLALNRNDADNLVQLASCFSYLGRAAEGEALFKRSLLLNPYRNLWYYQYGSFSYFVQKKFKKSIEMALKRQITNAWVDLPGYVAAAYAYLGEKELAGQYLKIFIDTFIRSITRGRVPEGDEILGWVDRANPFKHREDLDAVIEGLRLAGLEGSLKSVPGGPAGAAAIDTVSTNIFRQEGDVWQMVFDNVKITMADIKGYHDIARLLAQPESDLHCTELMGTVSSMDEKAFTIDDKARKAYEQHITELREDISAAEEMNDIGSREKLQAELDQFIEHLTRDMGVGKRPRKLKSQAEKARAAVTLRIRNSIKKISDSHPLLGKHLSNSIRTGVFCRYSPEEEREWKLH